MATDKQVRMLMGIARGKVMDATVFERLQANATGFPNAQVQETLTWLNKQPDKPAGHRTQRGPAADPGLYRHDGNLYTVRERHSNGRPYRFARELVPTQRSQADRARAADGSAVKLRSVPAPGMIWRLQPAEAVTLEEVAALNIQFGECLICGTPIETYASVVLRNGIGPVCFDKQTKLLARKAALVGA